ncbi:hypothetical protein SOI76_06210 [Acinetobacter pittii]|uniref:hypothetical protein n=1 Tax=Acinetobacter pittii TaxID=48296 RepID=UPI000CE34F67|nr:hypothetical protein [Acinetobacter pittii]PPC07966.1 hypothetical protein ApiMCR8900_02780 [Acinetobacter pittii]WPP61199.1 hypothetical protein SOI76_06210 [Acinetobacter pittii]
MIVSNNFDVPYYLSIRMEKGMTAYYWATHQSELALFESYELAYQFYFPSRHIWIRSEVKVFARNGENKA